MIRSMRLNGVFNRGKRLYSAAATPNLKPSVKYTGVSYSDCTGLNFIKLNFIHIRFVLLKKIEINL